MFDNAARRRAGIVDHDIDTAEFLGTVFHELLGLVVVGQIGRDGDDPDAGRIADFLRGFFQRFGAASADRHVDAFLRQSHGNALADAFATAGDQGGLPFEL